MQREIRAFGDPVLTQRCAPAGRADNRIRQILDDLRSTVKSVEGAGLAAPQIGVPLRLCVVKIDGKYVDLVDPVIVDTEGPFITDYESCLSNPGWWGEVTRPRKVWVRSRDRFNKANNFSVAGFAARCIQHEVDHLDGVLFTDHVVGELISTEQLAAVTQARAKALVEEPDLAQVS